MNTVVQIISNDLKRDLKHPWSMMLFAVIPLGLSFLIASIFGSSGKSTKVPVIHIAVLDNDQDFLSHALRSLPSQGDAAKNLQLQFVQTREEGLRILENRKASAFLVLPDAMTDDLLNGRTNSIELYENAAEQVLPKIVRQGTSLLASGLSSTAEIAGEPLRNIREIIRSNDFPTTATVTAFASDTVEKLRGARTYLFPPIIKFETIAAADFRPYSTNNPASSSSP